MYRNIDLPQDESIPCKTPEYCGAISCDDKGKEHYIREEDF